MPPLAPSSTPLLRAAVLVFVLVLVAPIPAAAWSVYNLTTRSIKYQVYDTNFDPIPASAGSGTLSAGASASCNWGQSACNPEIGERQVMYVRFTHENTDWGCGVTMLAGGYAQAQERDRTADVDGDTPDHLYCQTLYGEGGNSPDDLDGDGNTNETHNIDWSDNFIFSNGASTTMTPANRSVRFLITGDPQFDHRDISREGSTVDCNGLLECSTDPGTGSRQAVDTLREMRDLAKSDRTIGTKTWERLNNDVRGMIVSGDITSSSRLEEFKIYVEHTANHHLPNEERPDQFKWYEGLGNHDGKEENSKISCGQQADWGGKFGDCDIHAAMKSYVRDHPRVTRRTKLAAGSDPHYSWDWHDVHFVQLNIVPSDDLTSANGGAPQRDPFDALTFLEADLAQHVADPLRPVVLIHHYGFDTFSTGESAQQEEWWTPEMRRKYWNAIANYNVIAIFTGHRHLDPTDFTWDFYDFDMNDPVNATPGSPWNGRSDCRTSIPAFNAAAGTNGTYLDVTITENTIAVTRTGESGTSPTVETTTEDIYPHNASCTPNPYCGDETVTLPAATCLGVQDYTNQSVGICSQTLGPQFTTPGVYTVDVSCDAAGASTVSCSDTNDEPIVTVEDPAPPYFTNAGGLPTGTCNIPDLPNGSFECGAEVAGGFTYTKPTRDNTCGGSLSVSCTPRTANPVTLTNENIVCTVTDATGQQGQCAVTIPGFDDRLDPVPSLADSSTIMYECGDLVVDPGGATAADLCDGTLTPISVTQTFNPAAPGTSGTFRYNFEDAAGNDAFINRGVWVLDTQPPGPLTWGGSTTPPTLECSRNSLVVPTAIAADHCAGDIAATASPPDLTGSAPSPRTVNYTVDDGAGHAYSQDVTFNIVDTLPPQITVPLPRTMACPVTSADIDVPTIEDECYPPAALTMQSNAPAVFPLGTTLVTWTGEDPKGNQATTTGLQLIHVEDQIPPTITAPPDLVVACTSPTGAWIPSLGTPIAADECNPAPIVTSEVPATNAFLPIGTTTVTWSVSDATHAPTTDEQVVTVVPGPACDPDGTLYTRTAANPDTLHLLEQTDASTFSLGAVGVEGTMGYAADRDTGLIWAVANNDSNLYEIDPATGAATAVGAGLPVIRNAGLAYDPNGEVLYGSDVDSGLYTIDTQTGAKTFIANFPVDIAGLAYDPNLDVLYATGPSDQLYTVNPNTAALTTVGALGVNIGVCGLAYDYENDVLYLTDVGSDALYSVNTTTGAATLIGPVAGVLNPVALTYLPEPSMTLGVFVGAFALGWARRRPRSRA